MRATEQPRENRARSTLQILDLEAAFSWPLCTGPFLYYLASATPAAGASLRGFIKFLYTRSYRDLTWPDGRKQRGVVIRRRTLRWSSRRTLSALHHNCRDRGLCPSRSFEHHEPACSIPRNGPETAKPRAVTSTRFTEFRASSTCRQPSVGTPASTYSPGRDMSRHRGRRSARGRSNRSRGARMLWPRRGRKDELWRRPPASPASWPLGFADVREWQ